MYGAFHHVPSLRPLSLEGLLSVVLISNTVSSKTSICLSPSPQLCSPIWLSGETTSEKCVNFAITCMGSSLSQFLYRSFCHKKHIVRVGDERITFVCFIVTMTMKLVMKVTGKVYMWVLKAREVGCNFQCRFPFPNPQTATNKNRKKIIKWNVKEEYIKGRIRRLEIERKEKMNEGILKDKEVTWASLNECFWFGGGGCDSATLKASKRKIIDDWKGLVRNKSCLNECSLLYQLRSWRDWGKSRISSR
jgi:hypothetical protein